MKPLIYSKDKGFIEKFAGEIITKGCDNLVLLCGVSGSGKSTCLFGLPKKEKNGLLFQFISQKNGKPKSLSIQ